MAVACSPSGVENTNFYSAQIWGQIAYHDFEGITVRPDEAPRLLKSLGDKKILVLRNHGLLAVGETLSQAFARLWTLQRACEVQLATNALGRGAIPVSDEVAGGCVRDALQFNPKFGGGRDMFDALVRPGAVGGRRGAALARAGADVSALIEAAPRLAPLLGPATRIVGAMNGVPWWFFPDRARVEAVDPGGVVWRPVPLTRLPPSQPSSPPPRLLNCIRPNYRYEKQRFRRRGGCSCARRCCPAR
jgi:hypothetical protein